MPDDTIDAAIAAVVAEFPQHQSVTGPERDTLTVLRRLCGINSDELRESDEIAVATLCRKISVARRLWVSYEADWSRPIRREPVPGAAYVVLGGLLLRSARHAIQHSDGIGPGLKFINGALISLDQAGETPTPDIVRTLRKEIDATLHETRNSQ